MNYLDSRPGSAAIDGIPHFALTSRNGFNDCRCLYECDEVNPKGERLVIELIHCGWAGDRMARERYREGRTDHLIEFWWGFSTYVYEPNGSCRGAYNPCEMTFRGKPDRDGHMSVRPVIDYEWHLDATPENARRLFAEAHRRFMACEPRRVVGDEYFEEVAR